VLDGGREAQPLHRAAIAADGNTALMRPVEGPPDLGFLRGAAFAGQRRRGASE
jgi:hypothetical protein